MSKHRSESEQFSIGQSMYFMCKSGVFVELHRITTTPTDKHRLRVTWRSVRIATCEGAPRGAAHLVTKVTLCPECLAAAGGVRLSIEGDQAGPQP